MRHPQAIDYARLKNESAETCDKDIWMAYGRSKLSQILMTKVGIPPSSLGIANDVKFMCVMC
jgi:hypothetical protein